MKGRAASQRRPRRSGRRCITSPECVAFFAAISLGPPTLAPLSTTLRQRGCFIPNSGCCDASAQRAFNSRPPDGCRRQW